MSNLILYGLKNVGKSTLGKKLALTLKRPFVDSDTLIELHYEQKIGSKLTCREIFKRHGEKSFRSLEKEVLASLSHVQNCVIALGGGSLLDPMNQKLMKSLGKLIYLHLEKWALKERLFSRPLPLFLTEESFDSYYEERSALYMKLHDCRIDLTERTERDILEKLLEETTPSGK